MNQPGHPTNKPVLADVPVSDPSLGWPACASCEHSAWMIDRQKPEAVCEAFGAVTFGEDRRFISQCEKHQPIK